MVNEKGIIKQYDVVVYPFYFVVAIGDVEKEINARYKPYEDKYNWIGWAGNEQAACTYNVKLKKDGSFAVMVWYNTMNDFKGSTLTHECDHAALEIFNFTGAKVHYDNQEPFCYLLGTIFRLCNNAFYHWKDFVESKTKKKKKR